MFISVAIRHTTPYQFDDPARLSPEDLRLRPSAHSGTPQARHGSQNLACERPVDIEITAALTVANPFSLFIAEYVEESAFAYPDAPNNELTPNFEAQKNTRCLTPTTLGSQMSSPSCRQQKPTANNPCTLNF